MNFTNKTQFDTQIILNEVESAVQKGLKEILKNFIDNYNLYQQTYIGVLNLPPVKELYLSKLNTDDYGHIPNAGELFSEKHERKQPQPDDDLKPQLIEVISDITKEYMDTEVKKLENTFLSNFQTFTSNNNIMIQQLLSQVESLKEEIKTIRRETVERKQIIDLTNSEDYENQSSTIEESVVIKVEKEEKENIILNIDDEVEETEENNVDEKEFESKEEQEEEEQEEEEEEQEEEEEEQEEEQEEEEEEEEEEEQDEQKDVEEEQDEQEEEEQKEEEEQDEQEEEEQEEQEEEEDQEEDQEEEEQEEPKEQAKKNVHEDEVETEAESEEEEEEEDFFEVEIDDKSYCTNDEVNGFIYELTDDGEIGEKVGVYKNSVATFYK
jgi:hypothetical protein